MADFIYSVLSNKPPIQRFIAADITGTPADTLIFPEAMTRFCCKNTGTSPLTFAIAGNADLTLTLAPAENIDESFLSFSEVELTGVTGSSYRIMVG